MKSAKLAPLLLASLVLLLSACTPAVEGSPTPAPVSPSAQPTQASTTEPTAEPSPVSTPTPEATPSPTPTHTPIPTPSPVPERTPIPDGTGDTLYLTFPDDGFLYTPDDPDMDIAEVALRTLEAFLDTLKVYDEDRTFQVLDYWVTISEVTEEAPGRWLVRAWENLKYVGNFGWLGYSDGSDFFEHLGTDGPLSYMRIFQEGDSYRMVLGI